MTHPFANKLTRRVMRRQRLVYWTDWTARRDHGRRWTFASWKSWDDWDRKWRNPHVRTSPSMWAR